jgi:hypothetical protein
MIPWRSRAVSACVTGDLLHPNSRHSASPRGHALIRLQVLVEDAVKQGDGHPHPGSLVVLPRARLAARARACTALMRQTRPSPDVVAQPGDTVNDTLIGQFLHCTLDRPGRDAELIYQGRPTRKAARVLTPRHAVEQDIGHASV